MHSGQSQAPHHAGRVADNLSSQDTTGSVSATRLRIRQFIVQNFLFGQDRELADDTSFLESGVIDSTGVLEVVAHLEETWGVKVRDDELIPDNLDSIDAIVAYVERKTRSAGTPG
jgi:acyl carrier protein